MADRHALVTGPITGRIPIEHDGHPEGHVDVTAEVLMFDDVEHVQAVADAIIAEHRIRGTHPESETGV